MNTDEWVHYTVHKDVKERLERAERNAERDRNAFAMLCEAIEKIEIAVGIDTGGWNGPGPAVTAVQETARNRDQLRKLVEIALEDGALSGGTWEDSARAALEGTK